MSPSPPPPFPHLFLRIALTCRLERAQYSCWAVLVPPIYPLDPSLRSQHAHCLRFRSSKFTPLLRLPSTTLPTLLRINDALCPTLHAASRLCGRDVSTNDTLFFPFFFPSRLKQKGRAAPAPSQASPPPTSHHPSTMALGVLLLPLFVSVDTARALVAFALLNSGVALSSSLITFVRWLLEPFPLPLPTAPLISSVYRLLSFVSSPLQPPPPSSSERASSFPLPTRLLLRNSLMSRPTSVSPSPLPSTPLTTSYSSRGCALRVRRCCRLRC